MSGEGKRMTEEPGLHIFKVGMGIMGLLTVRYPKLGPR